MGRRQKQISTFINRLNHEKFLLSWLQVYPYWQDQIDKSILESDLDFEMDR